MPTRCCALLAVAAAAAAALVAWYGGTDDGSHSFSATVGILPESATRAGLLEDVRAARLGRLAHRAPPATAPAEWALEHNLTAAHPVVVIPGFVSSGLDLWQGRECAAKFLRQRVFYSVSMVDMALRHRDCWLAHMEVDAVTGEDPEGVRVRAAEGVQASEYVLPGYWLWARFLDNLARLGYGPETAHVASYDWRLPFGQLERRDRYFSRLAAHLELSKRHTGKAAVVVAHSMGAMVWLHFAQWAVSRQGGKRNSKWLGEHVEAVALVGGPLLGAMSVLTGMLMGDCADLAAAHEFLAAIMDSVASPAQRRRLFRSTPSAQSMLPMGGEAIWGNASWSPEDPEDGGFSPGAVFRTVRDDGGLEHMATADEAVALLEADAAASQAGGARAGKAFRMWHPHRDPAPAPRAGQGPESAWVNPLRTAIPRAPNLKVYCMYGTGVPTERAYVLERSPEGARPGPEGGQGKGDEAARPARFGDGSDEVPVRVNRTVHMEPHLRSGVHYSDGDGTVSAVSAAYMCLRGWDRRRGRNPSGAKAVARSYTHDPSPNLLAPTERTGPGSAAHVDILGNHELIKDLLRLAAGRFEEVGERVGEGLERAADRIDGELRRRGQL